MKQVKLSYEDLLKTKNVSNPNLLINGDFRINQRGESSYSTNSTYTVDRWLIMGAKSIVSVNDDGSVTQTTSGAYQSIIQFIEFPSRLAGKTVTLSAKYLATDTASIQIRQGALDAYTTLVSSEAIPIKNGTYSVTATIPDDITDSDNLYVVLMTFNADTSTTWYYAKLEVGEVATPYSPRPYAEELSLCQRYYQRIGKWSNQSAFGIAYAMSTSQIYSIIHLQAEMRTAPTVAIEGNIRFRQTTSSTSVDITDISFYYSVYSGNAVLINLKTTSSTLSLGAVGVFSAMEDITAYLEFDAEIY